MLWFIRQRTVCSYIMVSMITWTGLLITRYRLLLKKYRVPQDNPSEYIMLFMHYSASKIILVSIFIYYLFIIPPVIYQLALVEREINELIHGYHSEVNDNAEDDKTSSDDTSSSSRSPSLKKPLSPDDVCPICQEDLLMSPLAFVHCRWA